MSVWRKLVHDTRENSLFLGFGISLFFFIFAIITEVESGIGYYTSWIILTGMIVAFFIVLLLYPFNHPTIRAYGGVGNVTRMIKEAQKQPKIYEDDHIIITKEVLLDKNDYSAIVRLDDITLAGRLNSGEIRIGKIVREINSLVISDVYDRKIKINYVGIVDRINPVIELLVKMRPNIESRYSRKH